MATYPARADTLHFVVQTIAPQLDKLTLVLNQYKDVPPWLAGFANVDPVIPDQDTKDCGKLLPRHVDADLVFLLDDDILYPADYVSRSCEMIRVLNIPGAVYGHHGLVYIRPRLRLSAHVLRDYSRIRRGKIFKLNQAFTYMQRVDRAHVVDELGTGVLIAPPQLLPRFDEVADAMGFIDTRVALLSYRRKIPLIALPHDAGWLKTIMFSQSLYEDFSRHCPPEVADEIRQYAFGHEHTALRLGPLPEVSERIWLP
ncbi:hypothetical protein ACFQXB_00075 [Plastorhodobacter daqingensis]|uniref:Glycosyltransferase family 2 protein n=1 Tax=Plastorhodobacter daqingensis TaxID=1387281 RepID=A0ABW2UD43_9RHOB